MRVVVIGAAKTGYAESITRKLINEGYSVIGTYDEEYADNAKKMQAEFSADVLTLKQVDLSSRNELSTFVKSVEGEISGMIFAQFFFYMEDPDHFDHLMWDKSLAINLTAPNYLVHELKDQMVPGSSIVIITSTEAYRGSYGASAYAATKTAIHNLVRTLANNLGQRGIRINALPAGWIGGEMDTDEVFNKSRSLTPLGRLGTDEEIANVAYFLFSKESSFVNGTTIVADGGYLGSDPLSKYEFEDSRK
ncbi:MAG: SDR family oxidoreductase [Roseburia faecis]|jgi:putative 3-oxoacyl-ACP reductase|uniref:SDR family oxidoreductase n=1 Tax=Roseburia faecis TaxID=301302 RepID=UPI0018992340|nr:SDR family oxidoreductase [Roseburia faecis]